MTDSPEEAADKAPKHELKAIPLLDLLGSQLTYTKPAHAALWDAIKANATDDDHRKAVNETLHFDAIKAWCEANPRDAAHVVLCSTYLLDSRIVVQAAADPQSEPEVVEAGA